MMTNSRAGLLARAVAAVALLATVGGGVAAGVEPPVEESPLPAEGEVVLDVADTGWTRVDLTVHQETRISMLKQVVEDVGPGFRATQGWLVEHTGDEVLEHADWMGMWRRHWGESTYQRSVVNAGGIAIEEESETSRTEHDERNYANLGHAYHFPPGEHSMIMMYGVGVDGVAEVSEPELTVRWAADEAAVDPYVDLEVTHHTEGVWIEDDRTFDMTVQARDDTGGVNVVLDGERTLEFAHTASGVFYTDPWRQPISSFVAGMVSVDGPRPCRSYPTTTYNQGLLIRGAPPGEYTFHGEVMLGGHHAAGRVSRPSPPTLFLFMGDLPIPEIDPTFTPGEQPVREAFCEP